MSATDEKSCRIKEFISFFVSTRYYFEDSLNIYLFRYTLIAQTNILLLERGRNKSCWGGSIVLGAVPRPPVLSTFNGSTHSI